MIKTTAAIASGKSPKDFPSDLIKAARRKLVMLDNAAVLDDLKSPPGNKLHPLLKDRWAACNLDQQPVQIMFSLD